MTRVRGEGADHRGDDLDTIDPVSGVGSGPAKASKAENRVRPATRSTAFLVAVAVVVAAAIGGVVGWRLRAEAGRNRQPAGAVLPLPDTQQTVVPNVFGLTPSAAQKTLAQSGLASSVNARDLALLTERSVVIAQEPGAGERVAVGSVVGLRTLRDEAFSHTPLAPDRPVRSGSPQNRDYPWSFAVGTFDLRCEGTRPAELAVSLERLPVAFDYAWVVTVGDANEFVPLASKKDLRGAVTGAIGNAAKFSPTAYPDGPTGFGTAHVSFELLPGATTRVDQLTLVVSAVPRERSYLLNAPRARCP
jgi:PASTA domain